MPERGDDLADDPGLLGDLADGGVLGGLALLDVPLRQGPEEPAAAVGAADQGSTGPGHTVVGHHQAPGGGLVDPAQPAAGASAPARPSHARRVARRAGTTLARRVRSRPRVGRLDPGRVPPAVQETVRRELVDLSPVLDRARRALHRAPGFEVHLVGGSVRDALLAAGGGRRRRPATSTSPPTPGPSRCSSCCAAGPVPRGTPDRLRHRRRRGGGVRLEITTFRADRYDRESRNPEVAWGDSLVDDLRAPRLHRQRHGGLARPRPARSTDPFGGLGDLLAAPAAHARRGASTPSPTTRCGCCAPSGSSPSSG